MGRPCAAGGWDRAREASRPMSRTVARREGHVQPGTGDSGQGCHHPRVCGETKHLGVQVLAPPRDAFRGATGISGTRCYFKPPARSGLGWERWGFGVTGFLCGPAFSFVPLTAVRTSPTYAGSTKAGARPALRQLCWAYPGAPASCTPSPARSGVASAGEQALWAGSSSWWVSCILAHLFPRAVAELGRSGTQTSVPGEPAPPGRLPTRLVFLQN